MPGLSGCSGRMNKDQLTGALPTVVGNNAGRAHSSITRLPLSCLSPSLYLLLTFIRETAHLVSNVSHSKCTKDDVTSRQFCWVPLIKPFHQFFHRKYVAASCNTARHHSDFKRYVTPEDDQSSLQSCSHSLLQTRLNPFQRTSHRFFHQGRPLLEPA